MPPTPPLPASPVAVLAFSADKNRIVWQKGGPDENIPGGLGIPLLLYYLLDLIRSDALSWCDEVIVNENAAKESHEINSLGLTHLENVDLHTLFRAAIVSNSPDAILALAGHISEKIGKSKNKTVPTLKKIGKGWGIPESAIKNTTGRFYNENPQYFTPIHLLNIGIQLLSFDLQNLLSHRNYKFGRRFFESDNIVGSPLVSRYFSFSTGASINVICMSEYSDETVYTAVCGAKTPIERDKLLLEAIHRSRTPYPEPHDDFITTNKSTISLCGDTYCGERYTKWRIARNIEDPIQKYGDAGYAYSFEKVAPLISQRTFNIVNSECILSPVYADPQQTGKYIGFVLGAHPEKTIACYKQFNINAVMLANNHAMDFGAVGCRQTRRYFKEAGLIPIGTGGNIDEAEKPLLLKMNGKQVIVFNAYCYFTNKRYRVFKHYCFGANPGTAFGTDFLDDISLWHRIHTYRAKFPDAFIVFSPHWSTDFNERHLHLQPIAEKALDAGVDVIIGHGPHIPIGAEHINGKLCLYSIGNFVFNTTGVDLDASGKSPYGIVAQIDFSRERPCLRLYPIYAHNLNTFFQPYPITGKQQHEEFLAPFIGNDLFSAGMDEIGYYLHREL